MSSVLAYHIIYAVVVVIVVLHPFIGRFSRIAWVSWYQKGKTSVDLNEARDGMQWH